MRTPNRSIRTRPLSRTPAGTCGASRYTPFTHFGMNTPTTMSGATAFERGLLPVMVMPY